MKRTVIVLLATMSLFARLFGASDHEARKREIQKLESGVPSAEAKERKSRSIASLKQRGVPTTEHLPVIEDSSSAQIRSPKEIAERLIACTIAAIGGETGDRAFIERLLVDFAATELLSPQEKRFVTSTLESQQDRIQFSWRYERSWVLLWALGLVENLDFSSSICDVPKLAGMLKGQSVEQLIRSARPRDQKQILDEADFIYRLHWALVEERVSGKITVPQEVERGVVQERHAALNWLIGYMSQDWDDISTDT